MTESPPPSRLLIVDDDASIVELLTACLRHAGFDVDSAYSGHDALTAMRAVRPDAVLLDVMMPGLDGFEVVRRMRTQGIWVPVLFISARYATEDKVHGLTLGDDYVTKPFSLEEVIARIRALLRRAGHEASRSGDPACLAFADIRLDEVCHEVRKAGELVELTPTEFGLLRYLLMNQGRTVSKAQILKHVWSYDFVGASNVVETYMSYLRRKVDNTDPPLIHTIRGVGYVLRAGARQPTA